MIPIYVPCFNNPYYVKNLLPQLLKHPVGLGGVYLVDNNSNSLEMRALLDNAPSGVTVVRREDNLGPRLFQDKDFYESMPEVFVLTDPDLQFNPALPNDCLERLYELTELLKIGKAGFSLRIDDCSEMRNDLFDIGGRSYHIWEWESQFWTHKIANLSCGSPVYSASIDTTFALYNKRYFSPEKFLSAVRVAGNYTCRHLPWYKKGLPPSEELTQYKKTQKFSYYLK